MEEITAKEKFFVIKKILSFKPTPALELTNAHGREFLLNALIIVSIISLLSFNKGFNLESTVKFISSFISFFIVISLVYFLGKWFFKGEADFLGLLSSLAHLEIILIYLVPLTLLLIFSFTWIILLIIFLIYYFILLVHTINICHRIKTWKSVILVIITWSIVGFLNWGVSILFKFPAGNIAGKAIGIIV